jgi:hypothetical protein
MRDVAQARNDDTGSVRPVRPMGLAGGWIGRDLNVAATSVAMLVGLGFMYAGVEVMRGSTMFSFSYDAALQGVLSQLSVTGPAAALVASAVAANILAAAVVLRFLSAKPFDGLSELILAGFASAVVLDAAALFVLGSVGLFGWPELLVLHLAVATAYLATRRSRPLLSAPIRIRVSRPAAWWPLILAVWAWPLILQLASPAVPFMDVLPNHVAPVEHIRVFGSFSSLITSPSPIYGPSRLMLGYVAFLGQATTLTGLDAVLAEAAFALPLTILIVLSLRRLTGELFGGSASFWVLLTFPLTFTFTRITDSRGTVAVFPIAAWLLCVVAAELRASHHREPNPPSRRPDFGLTFALGAAVLVHPLIGLAAIAAVGFAFLLYPARLGRRLIPAMGGAAFIAAPQALTMAAIDVPSWVGALFIAAGLGFAMMLSLVLDALARSATARGLTGLGAAGVQIRRLAARLVAGQPTIQTAVVCVLIVLLLGLAGVIVVRSTDPTNPTDPNVELMRYFPHLVWLAMLGAALSLSRLSRGWIVLGCGIAAGLAAWATSGLVGNADLTQLSVHYEVPKSIEYWLPAMLAVGAAGAIAAVYRMRRLGQIRAVLIGMFLVLAIYPTASLPTSNAEISENPASESLAIALREAQFGYWNFNGYPDTRLIIDAPRQQVVDQLRAEESAGRLGPSTRVLNIASSFQQWTSVPIGVFTGAMETSISLQPELSIHTVGGRLYGFDRLPQELASDYGYVVLQPGNISPDLISQTKALLSADGYSSMWSNSLVTIYRHG